MSVRWIVVAHRAGARIWASSKPGAEWDLLREIDHPQGRAKASEIDADAPGEAFASHGSGHSAYQRSESPTEHVAAEFARELSDAIETGRVDGSFDGLVLVAAPAFLGLLRDALSAPAQKLVEASLDKDLPRADATQIRAALADVIRV